MLNYVVCEDKGSRPRIHVKICEHRCPQAPTCESYQRYLETQLSTELAAGANHTEWPLEPSAQGLAS